MKNILTIIILVAALAIPYLVVGLAWCGSLGAFDYNMIVTSQIFYAASVIYWVCFFWIFLFGIKE